MPFKWQYYTLKAISRAVCLLPYPAVLLLGEILGRLYYHTAGRQRRRAIKQIREGLGLSQEEAAAVIKRSFIKLGQTFCEVFYTPALNPDKIKRYVTIENRHYLEQALAQGKGVVFLTAHLGNWEWFGAALALNGFPVADIVKNQPNDQHTRILNEYRQMFGIEIFASGTGEIVRAARALKKGKLLGFFADQDAGKDGVFVEFLGKMASTPLGPAVFARKFKCPVVPGFIVREADGRHRITIQPPIYFADTGDPQADLYDLTVRMTKIIEDAVKAHPDEWLWARKRWNTDYQGSEESR
ncbi:MAG TPA: lysophospholipid acyltransferase family protein [Methylomusa anaerophila]|uniref:Phosphatidylinositol mannoside acyltransferase n=1 Tax=Methylomusa anaerophila TaxID=1930071 RepID=A0A348AKH9_9FIRM|nr:lysophospholipid acyltransferase family protein [Methylomusa anaerophila]BBB91577.1 phosphatidylinositol mannoside acyltransferase [Methylomusa anaerophila]HML89485.1 lysophospholipid acyltransferase family protein [Methylomusa anaerophila]